MPVGSLRNEAYERIRGKLALGQWAAGSELSEPMLAEMLGISRTPVREALQQLEVEGLVERTPRRSTYVRTPDRRDILDLYELREALEVYAVSVAAVKRTPEHLERLRLLAHEISEVYAQFHQNNGRALSDAQLRRLLAVDMGFHLVLIQATGNRHLMKIVGDSHVMSRVFGAPRGEHHLKMVRGNHQVHRDIYEAVERSQPARARELTEQHIRQSLKITLEYFESKKLPPVAEQAPSDVPMPDYLVDEFKRIGLPHKFIAGHA
jgi:DNA-binding GntR family transcriptional regulator